MVAAAVATGLRARIISCVVVTAVGFVVAGIIAAHLSGTSSLKVAGRLLLGGALELGVTYGVGVAIYQYQYTHGP